MYVACRPTLVQRQWSNILRGVRGLADKLDKILKSSISWQVQTRLFFSFSLIFQIVTRVMSQLFSMKAPMSASRFRCQLFINKSISKLKSAVLMIYPRLNPQHFSESVLVSVNLFDRWNVISELFRCGASRQHISIANTVYYRWLKKYFSLA